MKKAFGVFLLLMMFSSTALPAFAANSLNLFSRVQTISTTKLYAGPGESSSSLVGTQSAGALGTTVSGPLSAADSTGVVSDWWLINFDKGIDGWTSEKSLGVPGAPTIAAPAPTPIPEPTPVPTPKPGSNIIYQNNFDNSPLGEYTSTQAKKEFPNVDKFSHSRTPNISIIQGTDEKGVKAFSGRALKTELYDRGTDANPDFSSLNIQFRLPGDGYDELYTSYMYTTSPNFKSDTGGKMAALAGSSYATGYSGGNCLTDGEFNTKVHLSGSGVGGTQNYTFFYGMKDRCSGGTGFNWDGGDGSGSRVGGPNVNNAHGVWHHIEYRVKMNTPGKVDGILQAWYDGKLMLDNRKMEWRKTDAHNIERAKLQAFVSGGNEIEESGHFLYYDNYVISTTRQGPPGSSEAPKQPEPPLPNPSTFSIGAQVFTTDNLNVRTAPTGTQAGTIKGTQTRLAAGTIVDGPLYSTNSKGEVLTWWKVDFNTGTDGWSVETYLELNGIVGLPKDVTPPTQPTALSAAASIVTSQTSLPTSFPLALPPLEIGLVWKASYDDRGVAGLGYKIFRDGKYLTATKNTFHSDSYSLSSGTTYTYTVQAFDAAGNYSIQSDKASATTPNIFLPPDLPTTFSVGATVQTDDNLNVRTNPTGTQAGALKGRQPLGAPGTITDGPLYSVNKAGETITWWKIDYDNGIDGWSVENYLKLVSGGESGATLLYQNDFENGWGNDMKFEQTCSANPDRFTIVKSPADDGSKVAKVYNDGTIPCKEENGELKHRAEIKLPGAYPAANLTGEDYWYGWRVFVPENHPTKAQNSDNVIAMQLMGGGEGPEFWFNLSADSWNIMQSVSVGGKSKNTKSVKSLPVEKGAWTDFVVYRKRSWVDGEGITKVWKNGELVLNTTEKWAMDYTGYKSKSLGNISMKVGAYWGTTNRNVKYTLYFDNMRVAKGPNAYSLVDPSKGGYSGGPTPDPIPVPIDPNPTTFSIGAKVFTTDIVNVRTAPSGNAAGTKIGTQPRISQGTIIGGPKTSVNSQGETVTWWQVDYRSGVDGWSVETYLNVDFVDTIPVEPNPTTFSIGAKVFTTDSLNVRTNPTGTQTGTLLGVQPLGAKGTIIDGPVYLMTAEGPALKWWKVDYANGVDGWSVETYLKLVSGGETGGGNAKLIYENTFNSGMGVYGTDYAINHLGSFTNTQFGAPTGCEWVKTFVSADDPDEAGNKVLRIRQDRNTCITNEGNELRLQKHRSQWKPEVDGSYFIPKDTEVWMGFRWRFNGVSNPSGIDPYVLQARLFGSAATPVSDQRYETPDIRVLDNGTNLGVRRAYLDSAGKQKYGAWTKIPIVPNKWMDIVIQHRLSSKSPDGYFRLWLNAASVNETPLIDEKNTWTGSYLDDAMLGGAYKYDYKTHHSIGWYWGDASTSNDHTMLMDDLRYAFGANGFDLVDPSK